MLVFLKFATHSLQSSLFNDLLLRSHKYCKNLRKIMTYPKIAFLGKYFPIQAIASSSFSWENIFSIWAAVN